MHVDGGPDRCCSKVFARPIEEEIKDIQTGSAITIIMAAIALILAFVALYVATQP